MLTRVTPRAIAAVQVVVCLAAISAFPAVAAGQTPPPAAGEATFNIFFNSVPVGFERAQLARTEDGWVIRASGQVTGPVPNDTRRFEAVYDEEWQPRYLALEATRSGVPFSLETSFAEGMAANEWRLDGPPEANEAQVDPASVVLPNFVFSAYEALAVRLEGAQPGTELPVYVAPAGQVTARVGAVDTQRIETADRTITATTYEVTFDNPSAPLVADIWVDDERRLLRIGIPSASLEVARQDLAAASTRLAGEPHPGDSNVRVPSAGFGLAATITTPVARGADSGASTAAGSALALAPTADGRRPAVVLVAGTGAADRDETVHGIPIFRQLAGALADRGAIVARYDKRGVGQSGGRIESATLDDYATDVRAVVRHLERRDDVDRDRMVVVGHGEGGWVGLLAARRERKIKALVMVASPGTTGQELVLEQQGTALKQIGATESEWREKVELQTRINRAVLRDGEWEGIPDALRRQADTPWFRSLLEFDPARVMRRVRQPILVIHGELDQQVLPYHADRIEALASQRNRRGATIEVARLDGINHLLVPATTGSVSEYASLADHEVSPRIAETVVDWIVRTLIPD